jgi:hypothetical protein
MATMETAASTAHMTIIHGLRTRRHHANGASISANSNQERGESSHPMSWIIDRAKCRNASSMPFGPGNQKGR